MKIIITTRSGREARYTTDVDLDTIVGLDPDGRVVVNNFDAFAADRFGKSFSEAPFLFGLTLCCNAYDKGGESDVYCRACYGGAPNADEGSYLFMAEDGTYPGFDPAVSVATSTGVELAPTVPDDAVSASAVPEAGHPTSYRISVPDENGAVL